MMLESKIIGSGNGPVLIILHGLFGESKNWISVAKLLSSDFEIHLIDQRNHGESFHNTQHNYLVLAEDLNNYIQDRNIMNYSIIGHSMGGKAAMKFSLLYGGDLQKLIIVDIAPKKYKNHYFKIFEGLKKVIHFSNSRKKGIEILRKYVDDIVVVNFLLKGFLFHPDNIPKVKFNINSLEKNIYNMLDKIDSESNFNRATYFLRGKKSEHIKDSDFSYISTLFPKYKVIDIENAGHWIHFDAKEAFVDIIKKILK